MKRFPWVGAILTPVLFPLLCASQVNVNEINYDPEETPFEPAGLREFIELYNPGPADIPLAGYSFTAGISYAFPDDAVIRANSYAILARDPGLRTWRNAPEPLFGPYEGKLSNEGERLTLSKPDGTVSDSLFYREAAPWPAGADGYGRTLERIAWNLPSDDYHTWRASLGDDGTPGRENSAAGTAPRPMIQRIEHLPRTPRSADDVTVQARLDTPGEIANAWLRYEPSKDREALSLVRPDRLWRYWKGTSAPSAGMEWTQIEFDDSGWETAIGGFGYGDTSNVNTILSDMRGRYTTFFMRADFQISDPAALEFLTLEIDHDDGYIAYINGREAARDTAPETYTHRSTATALHESGEPSKVDLGPASEWLKPGKNTLAVVGFNITLSNSSDFVLAPALKTAEARGESRRIPMRREAENGGYAVFTAEIPPHGSQTLVRCNIEIQRTSGEFIRLPHEAERHPFHSYFVYDGEIPADLPLFWLFDNRTSSLPERSGRYHAAVFLMPGGAHPLVFDGVRYFPSENGAKVKFNKGEEFRGDRTINIIPENPPFGGTAGSTGPFREYLGLWFYRHMGLLTPRGDWFRLIENPGTANEEHSQRLIVQQINERFLEMNGRDPGADLYKLEHDKGFMKHTNTDEGTHSIRELQNALNTSVTSRLRAAVHEYLDVGQFLTYSAVSILTGNWDGFHNNNWMYLNPPADGGKWEIIGWDMDKLWGFTDTEFQFYWLPVDYPLDGRAAHGSRRPGDITGPFHRVSELHEEYKVRLRAFLDREFAPGSAVLEEIERDEALLLRDLEMTGDYTGERYARRRNQIIDSYNTLREFIELRRGYLDGVLPVSVGEWALH